MSLLSDGAGASLFTTSSNYTTTGFDPAPLANAFYIRSSSNATGGINLITAHSAASIIFKPSRTEVMRIKPSGFVGIGTSTPTTALEVSGTISATRFVGDGSCLTGITASTDRIVSGSVNAVADVSSGAVRISGTLALNNTGSEPCDAAHYYTFRANPVTQQLEMCRP